MKTTIKLTVIIALVALIGFASAACSNSSGPQPLLPTGPIVISGTLGAGGGLHAVPRSLAAPEAGTQTFRAEVGAGNSIEGLLRDGSIIFMLEGMYDPATRGFTMQAPSTNIIFSIAGRLTGSNAIDTSKTRASVKVRDTVTGQWQTNDLTIASSTQSVTGTANASQDGVASIPVYCRGAWTDEITRVTSGGLVNLRYVVTKNSITMFDDDNPPQDFTVIDITPNHEEGPWYLTIQGKYYKHEGGEVDYTGKFYINKTFSGEFTGGNGIASVTVGEFFGVLIGGDPTPLSDTISGLGGGIRMFVTPYGSNNDSHVDMDGKDHAGYSPLFTGASAVTNANAATKLIATQGFTLALK